MDSLVNMNEKIEENKGKTKEKGKKSVKKK
jgi:hypothetical protein